MVTRKTVSRCSDFQEWKNTLINQYPSKYETKENAHFVLILMIKRAQE